VPEHGHPPVAAPAAVVLALLLTGHLVALAAARRRGRSPAWWRTAAWYAGLASAAVALLGPPGRAAHHDFTAHTVVHLLLGMLAPVLLVYSAPVTLLLRVLPVDGARRLSRVLASPPLRVVTHPVVAATLDAGGLWLLYTTGLYAATATDPVLHAAVHLHLVVAGYLFTASVLAVDPMPHRSGLGTRAAVLVAFTAAHAILAKYLYAHPPAGVGDTEAQAGALLMYYGGDLVHLVLIVGVCLQWYTAARPRTRAGMPATARG
jgi:putative membrane protein